MMDNSGTNENRKISIEQGNYIETIEGHYIQGNYYAASSIPKPTGFPQNIPASNTNKFIGRKTELELLHQQLKRNNEVAISAVEGMGGVGKTELAIQYSQSHLQLDSYPGGICWLRARGLDIGSQILDFARTSLGLQPPDDLNSVEDKVRWCWNYWSEGNTLIVVDDVTNYRHIKPYLPPQPSQFKVLITTRLKLDLAGSFYLQILSESDALKLLTELVGEDLVNEEPEKAKKLCQRLGCLPLALQLVGRYVSKRNTSLSKMLELLEKKGLDHRSLEVKENKSNWTSDITRGVKAAFELSWSELSQDAQELGCLLSLFALAPIEWSLVENTAIEQDSEDLEDATEDLEEARIELEDLHLLQGGDTYQLHQLIREFLQIKLNESEHKGDYTQIFCTKLIEIAQTIPEAITLEFINSVKNAIPHLTEVAENHLDAVSDESLLRAFLGLGRFYDGRALYALAEPWYQQCVEILKSRLGENHPDTASSLNNLAHLYDSQGRYPEAEPLYIQALELRKQLLGENHPDTALFLNNLANLYDNQGRYEEAEPLYIQALELRKQLLGENHPHTAVSLNCLGNLYNKQGRYPEAEPLVIQALELTKQLLGENHPHTAVSLNNLANLYYNQGRYPEAEPLYIQALELTKQLLGENHPDIGTSLNDLANLYNNQGKHEEAEPLYIQAVELYKQQLGENHPWTAISLNNLANLYYNQKRYPEAEPLYIQALAIAQQIFGSDHSTTKTYRQNLENVRAQQK